MIEPTLELGYTFLEKIQLFTGVSYSKDVLENIFKMYQLRKKLKDNPEAQESLDQAFDHFVKLETDEALLILEGLEN